MAPSLAESWTVSPDGLVYEFVLRKGAKFHNGDPVTAEDVEVLVRALSRRLRQDPQGSGRRRRDARSRRVRFRLKQPWPDFMTYYGTYTTGAGVGRAQKYIEKVGEDGFRKAPDRRRPLPLRLVPAGRSSW